MKSCFPFANAGKIPFPSFPYSCALIVLFSSFVSVATAQNPRPEDAAPKWIWLPGESTQTKAWFRKEVNSSGVSSARLYAACDDRMTIYVDGEKVKEHTGSDKPVFVDISQQLDLDSPEKQHVIAIEVENRSGPAGLLVKLDFESGWRKAWSIVSDASWKVSGEPAEHWTQLRFDDKSWKRSRIVADLGDKPWAKITSAALAAVAPLRPPQATPAEQLKTAKGFQVELLYSVPKETEGSWVNICHDPKGRLIVSDQYGSLYRVTPPGIESAKQIQVERINVDIGEAQGLLWAFDSLYVCVNRGSTYNGGLYRVRDTDGDDQLDSLETLRSLDGRGEHGPHAVLLHPDGQSLVVVCGNGTQLTEIDSSRVPRHWDEDLLLPRPQGRFMRGVRAPGGFICRVDSNGENWELISTGFRNIYDAAFNEQGDLFTYDADMEWDINTPWYRPTRICHVVSGAEFGWRSGGGKWPTYYADSLPPVIDIGPGSPTGVVFGYEAKFPKEYQQALFACDWSYGKLYALHLEPAGATYRARAEEFITGTPLPLTDLIINPVDGAMYFLIGGRRVQSGLYRVTYHPGDTESDAPTVQNENDTTGQAARAFNNEPTKEAQLRRRIEKHHLNSDRSTVEQVWPALGHSDRFVRFAARIALEHRPIGEWQDRALAEEDPTRLLTALLALARMHERADKGTEPDIDTPIPDWNATDSEADSDRQQLCSIILSGLDHLDWDELTLTQRLDYLRVLTMTIVRLGRPIASERDDLIEWVDGKFPSESQELNAELAQLMVYLQAPDAARELVAALESAPTQEEQIGYAKTLRHLRAGWTMPLRKRYFRWFNRASGYRGGASFATFVANIKADAVADLNEKEKQSLASILNAPPTDPATVFTAEPRPFVKKWTMEELVPLVENGLENRDFDTGRKMFGAAACFACHRFDNQGGAVGPDLTALSGRFSVRDLIESVLEPNKQISDQYEAVTIVTIDGRVITGRIVNLAGDSIRVQTNMLDPGALVGVDRKQIDQMVPSKVSMMPTGLFDTLNEEEILDLMAYLLSRGDRNHPSFAKSKEPATESEE